MLFAVSCTFPVMSVRALSVSLANRRLKSEEILRTSIPSGFSIADSCNAVRIPARSSSNALTAPTTALSISAAGIRQPLPASAEGSLTIARET
jgi:hypothetical protein